MIILIRFGVSHSVGLTGKPNETFFENVNSEWLVRSDDDVNSQIEFMTVDKKRIFDILWDDGNILEIYFWNVVDDIDSSTSWRICWFYDP